MKSLQGLQFDGSRNGPEQHPNTLRVACFPDGTAFGGTTT